MYLRPVQKIFFLPTCKPIRTEVSGCLVFFNRTCCFTWCLGWLSYNWRLLFSCIDWLFLGPSSSQTNLVFPDIIDGRTFSHENWALWCLHLCHHCRLIGFLQRFFSSSDLYFSVDIDLLGALFTRQVQPAGWRWCYIWRASTLETGKFHIEKANKEKYSGNDAFTTEVTGTSWPDHNCHTTTRKQLVRQMRFSHNLKTNIQMAKSHPMKL